MDGAPYPLPAAGYRARADRGRGRGHRPAEQPAVRQRVRGEAFRLPRFAERLVGRPLLSLGFEEEDLGKAAELAKQVLRGRAWDGTFASAGPTAPGSSSGPSAVPLRHPSGAIDGIVIVARQATRRSSQQERERIGLLERIGERLARSLELGITLRQVAETLVPQFADHCFIDLFQGDKLIRRAQIHAGGWKPRAGHLGGGGRADQLPGGALLPAGHGPAGRGRGRRPGRRAISRAARGQHGGQRGRGPDLDRGRAAGRPRRAARRDQPGPVPADRAGGAALRRRRPGFPRRGRQPGRRRDRQRDAVRGGAPHRAGLPDQPAAAGQARP